MLFYLPPVENEKRLNTVFCTKEIRFDIKTYANEDHTTLDHRIILRDSQRSLTNTGYHCLCFLKFNFLD